VLKLSANPLLVCLLQPEAVREHLALERSNGITLRAGQLLAVLRPALEHDGGDLGRRIAGRAGAKIKGDDLMNMLDVVRDVGDHVGAVHHSVLDVGHVAVAGAADDDELLGRLERSYDGEFADVAGRQVLVHVVSPSI
jgi:hypothetical protein